MLQICKLNAGDTIKTIIKLFNKLDPSPLKLDILNVQIIEDLCFTDALKLSKFDKTALQRLSLFFFALLVQAKCVRPAEQLR